MVSTASATTSATLATVTVGVELGDNAEATTPFSFHLAAAAAVFFATFCCLVLVVVWRVKVNRRRAQEDRQRSAPGPVVHFSAANNSATPTLLVPVAVQVASWPRPGPDPDVNVITVVEVHQSEC